MPDPHPHRSAKPATAAQQRYLRALVEQTGTSFSPPRDSAEASRQIKRLKARGRSTRADVTREQRQVQADLATGAGDAARYQPGEITGYGSNCRWSNHNDREDER